MSMGDKQGRNDGKISEKLSHAPPVVVRVDGMEGSTMNDLGNRNK